MSRIFEPIQIGRLLVRNRIVMSAAHLCYAKDGLVNDRIIDFYRERARGGAGLIIFGGCYPEKRGKVWVAEVGMDTDRVIPGLRRLAQAVHEHGAKLAVQLLHGGGASLPILTREQPVSASDSPASISMPGVHPRPMTEEDIKQVIEAYADATVRAREAGCDAVEMHCGMGYLPNQFLSPLTNRRTDGYGGNLMGRIRFVRELLQRAKQKAGDDFPIIMKLSGEDVMEGGLTIEESRSIARELEREGADALHIAPGWHNSGVPLIVWCVPSDAYAFTAHEIKKVSRIPVIASDRINTIEGAEWILDNFQADMVAMTRPFIADPEIVLKAQENRREEIRICVACNQACFDYMLDFKPVTCILNPQAGYESDPQYRIEKASVRKRVLVAGGGPAGMEAARVAALRGHRVTLIEKEAQLGGQIRQACAPPGKAIFSTMQSYYETQLSNLGVDVVLNTEANSALIEEIKPDAIVLAVGPSPIVPPIPGIDAPNAYLAQDVLLGRARVGKEVVIIGGGTVGCEVALYISRLGAMRPEIAFFLLKNHILDTEKAISLVSKGNRSITIVEIRKTIGGGFGRSLKGFIKKELDECDVRKVPNAQVKEIIRSNGGLATGLIIVAKDGTETFLNADTIVIACGSRPNNQLQERLRERFSEVYSAGDCAQIGDFLTAIHGGFHVAKKI